MAPPVRRQYTPRIPEQTLQDFQRRVLRLAADDIGRRLSAAEALGGLAELLTSDRAVAGRLAQHLIARPTPGGHDRQKITVRLDPEASEAFDDAVLHLGPKVGREITKNDALEGLTELLSTDQLIAGRLIRHISAKDQGKARAAPATGLPATGLIH